LDKKKDESKMSPIIKIKSRRSTVLESFVGKEVWIYTGKVFTKKKIKEQMVGHKFGEFAFTRAKYIYRKTKKNK
jgi:small subunit ribosomal protein S19